MTAAVVEGHLGQLSGSLRAACSESLGAFTCLGMIFTIQALFEEHKTSTLESIKAHYNGAPILQTTQMLDLKEPQPTPQQRTSGRSNAKMADEASRIPGCIGMGSSGAGRGKDEGGASHDPNERAVIGQLIGEGNMGFMSDTGFIGIMQQMWATSMSPFAGNSRM